MREGHGQNTDSHILYEKWYPHRASAAAMQVAAAARGARTRGCRRPAARPCRRRRRRRRRATVLESLRVPVPPPRARKPLADNCVASAHEAIALLRGLDHHRGTDGRDRVGIDPSAIALEVLDDLREAELHSICLHASSVSALAGTLEHSERLTIGQNGGM